MYFKRGSVDLITYGWSRIWLTTGFTLATDRRSSKLSTEKLHVSIKSKCWEWTYLETPIDLTLPSLCNSSICFHAPGISPLVTLG